MNQSFVFDDDTEGQPASKAQSPWEFSKYTAGSEEEHVRRRTTSVDHKISQLQLRKESRVKRRREGGSDVSEEDVNEETKHQYVAEDDGDNREDAVDHQQVEEGDSDSEDVASEKGDEDDDSEEHPEELENQKPQNGMDNSRTKNVQNTTIVVQDANGVGLKRGPAKFFASAEGASFSANSFSDLNLSRPLLRACEALGYTRPTPIQAACIPLGLTGRDICGSAVTGSGKTAAFALPLLERLLYRPRRVPAIRVMILTPTRELAVQVHSMVEKLAQFTDIRACLIVGGLSMKVQEVGLRSNPDIVVATPGRMIDHLHNTQSVGLEELAILVLDEADRLLEMGFSKEVEELVRMCPKRRQTMLFSATMTEEVTELVKLSLDKPVRLSADPSTKRPSTLLEEVVRFRPSQEENKEAVLLALCLRTYKSKVIIFSGTKLEAHRLKILFGLSGLKAAELHGNLTQTQRLEALESFRKMEVDFLIATDVAARGLDIIGVETVINFHCPRDITTYVHRVGRTARAGQKGCAVTFVLDKERSILKAIAKKVGSKLQSRLVAALAVEMYRKKIEEMEEDVRTVISEERDERALRKAEMEANKAQNLMDHEAEIYARPKKVWFQTSRDKTAIAEASKAAKDGTKKVKKVITVEEADEIKKKERRKAEKEKKMTRKKRRRLEAAREDAEDFELTSADKQENPGSKNKIGEKRGRSVVDVAYQRAKAAKGAERARAAGKIVPKKSGKKIVPNKKRKLDMEESTDGDVKRLKHGSQQEKRSKSGVSKKAFKSKARYKRRK